MDEVYDPAPEVVDASFAKTARRANALGITTVGMVNPTFVSMENPYAVLAGLNAKGDLPLRVFLYTDLFENESLTLEQIKEKYAFSGTQVEWHGLSSFLMACAPTTPLGCLNPIAMRPIPAVSPRRIQSASVPPLSGRRMGR